MSKPKGTKNIRPFDQRDVISTNSVSAIASFAVGGSPLERFERICLHQQNYLAWLEDRHNQLDRLLQAKSKKGKRLRRPKDKTFRKYRWHSARMVLLDTINAFENFFKETVIGLATVLKDYVPLERIEGTVDAKYLWSVVSPNAACLIFEHQLFHNLESVDKATGMLVTGRRYNPNSQKPSAQVKCLKAIFQVRHTLSHNYGSVTQTDASKFGISGYRVCPDTVIDPSVDRMDVAITRFLKAEAASFTAWLRDETIKFLASIDQDQIRASDAVKLRALLGGTRVNWDKVPAFKK